MESIIFQDVAFNYNDNQYILYKLSDFKKKDKKTLKNVINKENFQIKSADLVQKLIQKQESTLISDLETLINIIFTNFQDLKVFEQAYRIGLISRIAVNNQKILEKGQFLQNQEINILDKMIKYLGYSRMSPTTILIADFNRFIASTFKNSQLKNVGQVFIDENIEILSQNNLDILQRFPDGVLYNNNVVDNRTIDYYYQFFKIKEKEETKAPEKQIREYSFLEQKQYTEASLVKILKKEKLLDKQFLFTLVYTDLKPYFILDQKLYEKALKAMHDRQYIEEKEEKIEYVP